PPPSASAPKKASSQQWLAVTRMQKSVAAGYRNTHQCRRGAGVDPLAERLARSASSNVSAHQLDQPKWRLGMAAYWLETTAMPPSPNFQMPPHTSRVSTRP